MSFDYEKLLIFNELSEIIRWHNQCIDRLGSYKKNHPYLIAPNLHKMMEENLKENVQMLYRELNNLNKPKQEQKRHVCRECHGVFASSLPGGLCDECRSRVSAGNRYAAIEPESEVEAADAAVEEQGEQIDTAEAADTAAEIVERSPETENAAQELEQLQEVEAAAAGGEEAEAATADGAAGEVTEIEPEAATQEENLEPVEADEPKAG